MRYSQVGNDMSTEESIILRVELVIVQIDDTETKKSNMMNGGDEGGMEVGTTGLRGVATSARGGHTCVAAGRWRVEDRPPRTPPESKCRKEAMSGEEVGEAPQPP